MMVVDSKKDKVLALKELLQVVGGNIGFGADDKTKVVDQCVKHLYQMDDFVQIGNTIFIYDVVNGRANGQVFNADTGKNFIVNCVAYFGRLQAHNVTHFTAVADCSIRRCLYIFGRLLKRTDSKITIFPLPDKSYMHLIVGSQKLVGRAPQ
jgi:hypothetical protein